MRVGDWFEVVAARRRVAQWQTASALAPQQAAQARAVLGADAAPPWRGFLDVLALWLGAVLLGAGVIFFIAANWEQLGKFARLIGMQVLLVAAVAAAIRLAHRRVAGEAALFLAVLLLGALLALLGQTYQTGADTWQLFALWAALALPWAVAARSAVVWLTWVALIDVALMLWLDLQPWRLFSALTGAAVVGLVNVALLLVWETAAQRLPEFAGRIAPRIIAAVALAALTFGAAGGAIERRVFLYDLLPWLVVTVFLLRRYRFGRRDVVALAMVALGVIVVATTLLGRLLADGKVDVAGVFLVLAIAVVGQSAAAAVWLRRLAREGDA